MSIEDEIKARCQEGRLHELAIGRGVRQVRRLYVSGGINDFLGGPWDSQEMDDRSARLLADLAWFIQGGLITVPNEDDNAGNARMDRLQPASEEVWDIRSQDPRPAIRIFGRFAAKDVFVGLTWDWRIDLKDRTTREGRRLWRDVVLQCQVEWRGLFVNPPIQHRSYPDGYISHAEIID